VLLDAEDQAPPVLATKGPGNATFPVWTRAGDGLIWVGSPPGGTEVHLAMWGFRDKVAAVVARGFARLVEPDRSPNSGLVVYAASSSGGGLARTIHEVSPRG